MDNIEYKRVRICGVYNEKTNLYYCIIDIIKSGLTLPSLSSQVWSGYSSYRICIREEISIGNVISFSRWMIPSLCPSDRYLIDCRITHCIKRDRIMLPSLFKHIHEITTFILPWRWMSAFTSSFLIGTFGIASPPMITSTFGFNLAGPRHLHTDIIPTFAIF